MMNIDSKRRFTPRRVVTKGAGGLTFVFTDHFPSLIELEMRKSEESKQKVKTSWNTQKPGAWERYKDESNKVAEKIKIIAEDESFIEEEVMEKIDRIQTKLKFSAFGKTRPQTNKAKKAVAEAEGSETNEAKLLLNRQSKRLEEEIKRAKETANGRVGKIYKMKEIIVGSKDVAQEAQAIKHPSTGELVVSNSEIKKVTLEYCFNTLKNNEPEVESREAIELKEELHKLRMKDKNNDKEYEITDEDFFTTLWKFERKKSKA